MIAEPRRRGVAVRLSVLFAAIFFVTGISLPYLPVWLAWTGLSAREIAIVSAGPLMVRVLASPAIAFAADRSGDHRRFLIGLAWSVVASQLLLAQMRTFWPILGASLLLALAWTTILPLAESIAIRGMASVRLDYGRMRLWGSISFSAAALIGGSVADHTDAGAIMALLIAGSTVLALAAHALAKPAPSAAPPALRPPPRPAAVIALLTTPTFLIFVFASGAVQAGHAVFYTFGTLHWSALGISPRIAGLLWTVGVGAEILLFATSGALLRRTGPIAMLALAAGAGIVRWAAMACEPPVWLLFGLQALHGLTFGATHIGAIHFLASALPQHQAGTAQAVYAAVTSGILLGGTTMLVGPLYADWGGRAYWAMAAVSAVGLIATMLLKKVVAGRDPTG